MFKSKLAISVAALLSVQVSQVCGNRFLATNTSTSGLLIAPAPNATNSFNTTQQCGECVLGGYVFCVKGPEQYSGVAPIQTVCCQNKTSCPQVQDKLWNCSSVYENKTLAEKLRVCPFDASQCGSQNIQIQDLGDAQCLRLPNVKKGNACLYRVKSQCGVPKFLVNDTSSSVFFSQVQLANTSNVQPLPLSDAARCVAPRNQTCICRSYVIVGSGANNTNVTRQVCDCETAFNVTLANNSCSSCKLLSDPLGNLLRQCICSLVSPSQSFEDQYCQCQRQTDLVTRASSLNCTCAKPVPARYISLAEEQCKCVTSFNQTTKSSFLDCVCRNAPICQDPLSLLPVPPKPVPAPCDVSYPCQCSSLNVTANNTQNLQCNCKNPSTGLVTQTPQSFNQCSCQLRITNNTWSQDCKCCLPDVVVRSQLIPPVTCAANSIKQDCQCTNSTTSAPSVFTQNCTCNNAQTAVQVSGIVFFNDSTQCDCSDTTLGTKACKCCVGPQILSVQLQPKCPVLPGNVSTVESCQCAASSANATTQRCDCVSRRYNNFTFPQLSINATSCYCAPQVNGTNMRACNCCVADAQYQLSRQVCPANRDAANCSCSYIPSTGAYSCDCVNRFFFNQVTQNVSMNTSQCACYGQANASANMKLPCTCCAGDSDLVRAPKLCPNPALRNLVRCDSCANTTVAGAPAYACNCNGTSIYDNRTSVTLRTLPLNTSNCGCVNFGNRSTCDCCLSDSILSSARPVCSSSASSESCQCQNVTTVTRYNVTTYNVTTNTTIVQTLNQTNTTWSCNCSNSRYPKNPLVNAQFSPLSCGCSFSLTANRACDCCADKTAVDNLVLASQTCSAANTSVQTCMCTDSMNCNCGVGSASLVGLNLNSTNCSCVKRPNATLNECRCCLPTSQQSLIPVAPVCAFNSDTLSCSCNLVGGNLQCSCNNGTTTSFVQVNQTVVTPILNTTTNKTLNVTSYKMVNTTLVNNVVVNQTLPQSQCGCLTTVNGNVTTRQCNCCVPRPLTCANTTVDTQACSCLNVTNATTKAWQWNCNCLRRDTNILGNLTFADQRACYTNPLTGASSCCVSKPQFDSQIPVLTCSAASQKQNCSCVNTTDPFTKKSNFVCGCTRNDNGIRGTFQLDPSTCLKMSGNLTGALNNFTCCVTPDLVATQIPRKSCIVEGNGTQPQFCNCATLNFTVNGTRSILNNCNCSRPEFLVPSTFNFSQSACLCQPNNATCECCVSPSQRLAMIPQVQCSVNDTTQFKCACTNATNNVTGRIDQTCSCNTLYLGKNYTISNLTSQRNGCVCNGTTCGCCISNSVVIAATEKVCLANETRSVCSCSNGTLNPATTKLNYNCTCNTFTRDFTVFNYTYLGLTEDQCFCRGQSNCTCCVAGRNPLPTQPVCNAPNATATVALPRCQCAAPVNGTQVCNCTRVDGSVETYNNNISLANCNCMSVANRTNGNTKAPFECSCCATPAQVAPPAPVCIVNQTVQQCSCLNISDARGRPGYNCDCNYQNLVTLKALNFPNSTQCGCANTNNLLKPCGCCISSQQYRDAITPKCDVLGTCVTINNNGTLTGNCTAVVNINGVNTTFVNPSMTLNQNSCGCYTDDFGKQICKCCMSGPQDITKLPNKQCRAFDQLPSYCECPIPGVNQTSVNCSCSVRSQGFSYFFPALRPNSSDCQCIQASNANRTYQQCSCCSPKTLIVNLQSPVCNAPQMSLQKCNCRKVFNATRNATVDVCDCPRLPSLPVNLSSQCACLNQTANDGTNTQNCTCCVQNPPLTNCERFAQPNQTDVIGCRCSDMIVNRSAVFACNCTKQISALQVLTRNNMIFNETNDCCCIERQDPISRKGFKQCNCSHPVVQQAQTCQCKVASGSNANSTVNCSCQDCNKVVQNKTLPLNKCQCLGYVPAVPMPMVPVNTTSNATAPTNKTNSTSNATAPSNKTNSTSNATVTPIVAPNIPVVPLSPKSYNCSCQVDFQGLCPQLDILKQKTVDEFTCAATTNKPSPVKALSDCTNSYDYLVAVVSTNKDSSVLMQVQSQQFMGAFSLRLSLAMLLAAASLMMLVYY